MKKMFSNQDSNKKQVRISTKFLVVLIIITVMSLIVNLIFSSLSWFSPSSQEGPQMQLIQDSPFRSETCSFSTYEAHNDNGTIVKDNLISSSSYTVPTATETEDGKIIPGYLYFITDVTNASKDYSTCISMFFSEVNVGINIGVAEPSNSYRTVSLPTTEVGSVVYDYYLIRNAYVKTYVETDVDGPGLLRIVWFVRNDSNSTMSITPSNLYLVYS